MDGGRERGKYCEGFDEGGAREDGWMDAAREEGREGWWERRMDGCGEQGRGVEGGSYWGETTHISETHKLLKSTEIQIILNFKRQLLLRTEDTKSFTKSFTGGE